jgi:hypothetical protein
MQRLLAVLEAQHQGVAGMQSLVVEPHQHLAAVD